MSRRKVRAFVAAAIVGGFVAVGAATSFAAAPLPSGTSDGNTGIGTGLGLPGVASVSESRNSGEQQTWSAVEVAGQQVIGTTNGAQTGVASPLFGVLNPLNAALCDPGGGPLAAQGVTTCVALLPSITQFGNARGSVASTVVMYQDSNGATGAVLDVLPSAAFDQGCGRAALVSGFTFGAQGTTPVELGREDSAAC